MEKVILDMDSVGDDILTIYFALLSDKLHVLGITAENGACGSMKQALNVALRSVEIAEKPMVKVFRGIDRPFIKKTKEENDGPVLFAKQLEGIILKEELDTWNAPVANTTLKADDKSAIDFIIETIKNNPNEVNLVATGPLTNIAFAILQDPTIVALIKHCYIMGGVFNIAGNMTPVVEYNIWADPEAAKIVFNAGINITLVPLDVCETNEAKDSMLIPSHLQMLASKSSNVSKDIVQRFPVYIKIWQHFSGFEGFPMDDIITMALLIDPTICTYTDNIYVDVELEGKLSRGQTVAFESPCISKIEIKNKSTRICKTINGRKFINLFLDTVSK